MADFSGEALKRLNQGNLTAIVRERSANLDFANLAQLLNRSSARSSDSTSQPKDIAGNSLTDAKRVKPLSSVPRIFKDFIGKRDRNDYYRVTLNSRSTLNLRLRGLASQSDADLELRDSNDRLLFSSNQSGNANEDINQTLDQGNYYVRVLRRSGDTNYRLRMVALPLPDLAGNSFDQARSVSVSTTPATFEDYVSDSSDPSDFYKFTLTDKTTQLLSSISGAASDLRVDLYNSGGGLLASNSSTSTPDVQQILGAGTYYMKVSPSAGSSATYKLSLSGTPIADNAGESPAAAQALTLRSIPTTVSDFVGTGDDSDYYKFTLSKASTFTSSILTTAIQSGSQSPISSALRVSLRDGNDNPVSGSYLSTADPTFSLALQPGTYYVKVNPSLNAQAFYSLNLTAV